MTGDSLWRHRDFRRLWLGDTGSQFGEMVTNTAAPLLAALVLAATPFQMGVLNAADTAAFLLIGLPAGAWVDRMRRRPLMLGVNVGRAVLLASVPVTWWLGVLTLTQLILVGLFVGGLTVFFDVAYQSYLPSLIGREQLVDGNSKLQASASVAQVSGPALGGGLTQLVGGANAVGVNALTYAWSVLCLLRIRTVEPPVARAPDRNLRREIAEGLKFVFGNRSLVAIVSCTGTSNLSSGIVTSVGVLVLTRQFHASAGVVGLLLTGGGIGGVAGALVARRIAARFGQARTIWLSLAVTQPIVLLIGLAGSGPLLVLYGIGWLAYGFGGVVYNVAQVSFRQAICPDRLLGRMNASVRFLVWGTIPLGALLGGALGSAIGIHDALWVGVAGLVLAPLCVVLSPLRRMRDIPRDETPDATSPSPATSPS
ncbi:MAG TPA: MFS transporter [Pseudonocardiaceae bacterium]|nr:MFS transporter [Pseudonocardiaceae bacterium]